MKKRNYSLSPEGCPVEVTLDVVGGKYKGMLLYHLLGGTRRFGELRKMSPTITQRTLTMQLRELEAVGIVHREVYAVVPPRVEYSLTDLGRTLEPIIRLMQRWGVDHMDEVMKATRAGADADLSRPQTRPDAGPEHE